MKDVTIDVKLTCKRCDEPKSWSLGDCNSEKWTESVSDSEFVKQCHFSTSPTDWVFELTCSGWNNENDEAFITINGINYCEGYTHNYEKKLYIEANPSNNSS